ncbi:IS1595 family transposase [Maritimibacter alexandrii]|uniref:IS1595 family transposase n=1 Tax=Maritimibacter alexandrii TaxID=2570355 RepID=UPI001108BB1D|nr:IS1595 family transposase [Maritimibacter alexandrii]
MSILSRPYFHNEEAAYDHLESVLWPDGPECPHCGVVNNAHKIPANPEKRVRHGLHRCKDCKKQYTVKVGTVFEASKVPLHKWLQAVYLMTSSKKGVSAHQLHRALEVTYKTAWFMAHRVREAMREGNLEVMGGAGGTVESDETFIGTDPDYKGSRRVYHHKMKVLSLVDRENRTARSFVVDKVTQKEILPILNANIDRESRLMTDQAPWYKPIGKQFAAHESVDHSKDEYVRGDVTTNTVEGYFSIFKRGMKGIYQHCDKKHLHRYLAEYDFRYNHRSAKGVEDTMRCEIALKSIKGKRLFYSKGAWQAAGMPNAS